MQRLDARACDALRPIRLETQIMGNAGGSALIRWGNTHVLCSVMLEEQTARFLTGSGKGWLTAEYAMLPASTPTRKARDGLKPNGRSVEIKRLIGRSLRAVVDFSALGERTIWVDCDVLCADGGTRTASITGAYVALALGVRRWMAEGRLPCNPLLDSVAAVSCGVVEDQPLLDLAYDEDSRAQVDCNFVITGKGRFVEVQGTGEGRAFTQQELLDMLSLAQRGAEQLRYLQQKAIEEAAP